MKVALYARVSTRDQNCEMQLRDLRAYCAARQFVAAREFVAARDYVDQGVSGARDSRPQLNELMGEGRPSRHVDMERVLELQASGLSLRRIAATLKVGYGTVRERLQANERKTLRETTHENGSITTNSAAL